MSDFIHLNVRSDYSFGDGASKIKDLVAAAHRDGQPALALTDAEALHGAFTFSKEAKAAGVKPIIGCQVFLANKEFGRAPITLLSASEHGYQNLCRLISRTYDKTTDSGEKRLSQMLPYAAGTMLLDTADDLICLAGAPESYLWHLVAADQLDHARQFARNMLSTYGDRFFIEICRHDKMTGAERAVETRLLELAFDETPVKCADGVERRGIPIVATSPVRYASPDRHSAYELIKAVAAKRSVEVDAAGRVIRAFATNMHLRSAAEMKSLFADLPEAYDNALAIGRRCNYLVESRKPVLPSFPSSNGRTEAEELAEQSRAGLKTRLAEQGIPDTELETYQSRLDYELEVIANMGFDGYFLIVADFIRFAHENDIPVGPGRGSGAGSLVAYALRITDIDPLPLGLLFERFLNPERVSMPDFDIDFCPSRRREVIDYVEQRYGRERVAGIATFLAVKSKTALRDVARVIVHETGGAISHGEANQLSKLIPNKPGSPEPMGIKDALGAQPELRTAAEQEAKYKALFELASQIEGLYRGMSTHAAGIIISGVPITDLAPVGFDDNMNLPVSQFDMKASESCGLVKFDFLGLETLTIIQRTVEHIAATEGVNVNVSSLSLTDQDVYGLFAQGNTTGIFQFESGGMRKALVSLGPNRIEDLIGVNALYRPGPMDQIPDFAARKRGEQQPVYPPPEERTKTFLAETFGIMVYQEQVMRVAQEVAGYTLGGADLLRRAMGKKIREEMERERSRFVSGATERGLSSKQANELFELIEKFAGYGFNKSHAAAYSIIAYRTAWLKVHYPVAFYSALMTYEAGNPEKLALIRSDMSTMGVDLLPPDINHSCIDFMPEQKEDGTWAVRFGLRAIKEISENADIIERARKEGGAYADLTDFAMRAGKALSKKHIEQLARVGCFDAMEPNRARALAIALWRKEYGVGRDLLGEITPPEEVLSTDDWGNREERCFEAVGFFFDEHPLDTHAEQLEAGGITRYASVLGHMADNKISNLSNVKLCGLIEGVARRHNQNGVEYLSVRVTEKNDTYNVIFYNNGGGSYLTEMQHLFSSAEKDRRLVVFLADLAYDGKGERNLFVKGRTAKDAESYLSAVSCDYTIHLHSTSVAPLHDEAGLDLTEDEILARRMERKFESLKAILDSAEPGGEGDSKVEIRIYKPDGSCMLVTPNPGNPFYRPNAAFLLRMKAIDGVSVDQSWQRQVARRRALAGGAPKKTPEPASKPAPAHAQAESPTAFASF